MNRIFDTRSLSLYMKGYYISTTTFIAPLKCYCSEFFDPHFFSLIKSAFLPDLFTTNRIEIGQFKPIL